MPGEVSLDVGARDDHPAAAPARVVECEPGERGGHALPFEVGEHLGVDEDDPIAPDHVLQHPGKGVAQVRLVALALGRVRDAQRRTTVRRGP
jgi:hypothetical protein